MAIPYIPLDDRGFRLAMGLRPLDLNQWFDRDAHAESDRVAKQPLLTQHTDQIVALTPDGLKPSIELAELVSSFVGEPLGAGEPLIAAARLVADDLCVMTRTNEGSWVLSAACVCAPSRWDLRDKVGATLDAIHQPVPGYHDSLAEPTRAVFDRLTPERSFWRLNWTLLDSPDLFQPSVHRRPPTGDPSAWWFRVERQTIRSLPTTRAVVFTIRTYVTSLADLLTSRPETATQLLHTFDTAPAETLHYKGWVGVADALRTALT